MTGFWNRIAASLGFLALLIAVPAFGADTKVSNFTSSPPAQFSDEMGLSRSGANVKVTVEEFTGFVFDGQHLRRFRFFDDLPAETSTVATPGVVCIESNTGTSAASSLQATAAANRTGVIQSTTGTTATGRADLLCQATNTILLGEGDIVFEAAVRVTTLSDGTNRYSLHVGLFDNTTAVTHTDAVQFVYDEGGTVTGCSASANWQMYTASNSTRTCTATSTAVSAGAWVRLRVVCNAGGTSCEWFVNGSSVGTVTTNIPTGSARVTGMGSMLLKSVGTTARTVDFDYFLTVIDFTTAR